MGKIVINYKHAWHWIFAIVLSVFSLASYVRPECMEDCLPGYLKHCDTEIRSFNNTVKQHKNDRICPKLLKVIKCIGAHSGACVENATVVFDNYTKEPYECQLLNEEIILLVQNNGATNDCDEETSYSVTDNTKTSLDESVIHQTPKSAEQNEPTPSGAARIFLDLHSTTLFLTFFTAWASLGLT